MLFYTGTIDVITDPHTMSSFQCYFEFENKRVLTRNEVKKFAIESLHEQVEIHGVKSITYKWVSL